MEASPSKLEDLKEDSSPIAKIFAPCIVRPKEATEEMKVVAAKALDFLIAAQDILHLEENVKYVKGQRLLLSAATLEKLIEKVVDDWYHALDPDFLDLILITHPYFISSEGLLESLLLIYKGTFEHPWQSRIRLRILENLKHWLKSYSEDLKGDRRFLAIMKNFVTAVEVTSKEEEQFISFLKIVMSVMEDNATENVRRAIRRTRSARALSYAKIEVKELDILEVDADEIAEQLSLINHDLFKAITAKEFIQKNFDNSRLSPRFSLMVQNFNESTAWVGTEVLRPPKPSSRALVISHFIKIAKYCKDLNNFHCAYAIVAGLNNAAISRLKATWERVPRRHMLRYKELCSLFDMSLNFKNYREALAHATPPVVPYLGLYPKDLTALEELSNILDKEKQLINLEKMRTLAHIVQQTREYQGRGYSFQVIPELSTYLRHCRKMSKEEAFSLSLEREPREKKKVAS